MTFVAVAEDGFVAGENDQPELTGGCDDDAIGWIGWRRCRELLGGDQQFDGKYRDECGHPFNCTIEPLIERLAEYEPAFAGQAGQFPRGDRRDVKLLGGNCVPCLRLQRLLAGDPNKSASIEEKVTH